MSNFEDNLLKSYHLEIIINISGDVIPDNSPHAQIHDIAVHAVLLAAFPCLHFHVNK